jgi:hypothetical protein
VGDLMDDQVEYVETEVPEILKNIPGDEDISKGKFKKLFRRLQTGLVQDIDNRLQHINGQLEGVHTRLDKKFGGMYKILTHQFLTIQENKIYNLEIQNAAIKEVLMEFVYANSKTTDTLEVFRKEYDTDFVKMLMKVKTRVDQVYKESQDGSVEEVSEEGQPDPGQELPNGIK